MRFFGSVPYHKALPLTETSTRFKQEKDPRAVPGSEPACAPPKCPLPWTFGGTRMAGACSLRRAALRDRRAGTLDVVVTLNRTGRQILAGGPAEALQHRAVTAGPRQVADGAVLRRAVAGDRGVVVEEQLPLALLHCRWKPPTSQFRETVHMDLGVTPPRLAASTGCGVPRDARNCALSIGPDGGGTCILARAATVPTESIRTANRTELFSSSASLRS